mgnify:CR=1 FL=1
MKSFKGQINLEFLAAAGFYILALGTVITAGSGILPQYSQEADRSTLNLEARSLTDQLMTETGSHTYSGGGSNWEATQDTIQNAESIGLASDFLVIERDKINALSTVSVNGQKLNYTKFKDVTGVQNQYRFEFIWMPTVQTNKSFTRTDPPSNPAITEPEFSSYASADNRVHYGEVTLEAASYKFLVTSHNGVYDRVYISDDWNFRFEDPYGVDENIPGAPFQIHSFQNRDRKPGTLLVLKEELKTFGATRDSDSIITTFQRFGILEGEPLKIQVLTW